MWAYEFESFFDDSASLNLLEWEKLIGIEKLKKDILF